MIIKLLCLSLSLIYCDYCNLMLNVVSALTKILPQLPNVVRYCALSIVISTRCIRLGGWRILLRNSPTHRRISFILRSKHEAWGSEWVKEQILQAFSPATEKMLWSEGGKSIFVCRGGGWLIRAEKLFSQSTSFHNSLFLQHAQRFSQKINYSIFFYDMRALIDNYQTVFVTKSFTKNENIFGL